MTTLPEQPAGFQLRCIAWTVDAALLGSLAFLSMWRWTAPAATAWWARMQRLLVDAGQATGDAMVGGTPLPQLADALLRDPRMVDAVAGVHSASWALMWTVVPAFALLGALYHPPAERSQWQGSVGKRLLGLRVVDAAGRPVSAGRGLARHVAASLSWVTLNLGHLMALLPPRHLALHDHIVGTHVVATAAPLPRWAWAWVAVLGTAGLAASIWLTAAMVGALQLGLERALA